MNSFVSCLTAERLRQLSADELSPRELEQLEAHVTHCVKCRDKLEQGSAEQGWWEEVRDVLTGSALPAACSGVWDSVPDDAAHDGCGAVEQYRQLLGPTDDPRMLGRIGPYEVVGILGRGGMGVVFKGFDAALNRYVAIKMLLPHLATSGGARKRFAREAQAAAAVIHDNVMAIHSVAEWQGVPYLVMPYGRGVSLQRRLSDNGPLEVREILRIGMQTARGLAAAHAQGLVHRDVKPANILLGQDVERVTLTDFGLARAVDDASLTRIGVLAGTPQYMSPEQARGKTVDARSDLFSLGSVLYAACTGRSPFRADSSYGVLRLILDEEPTPIRELNPEIPEWLCAIISKLMSKQAANRFESSAEVAELLERCLAYVQHPTAVRLPEFLVPQRRRSRLPLFSRHPIGVIAMIAAFGLGLLGLFAWQATEAPDIAGKWSGSEWGEVQLAEKVPGTYEGTFSIEDKPGTMELTWSRLDGRYKGAWRVGEERSGRLSLRVMENEIRGAWTTNNQAGSTSSDPELSDLTWKRPSDSDATLARATELGGAPERPAPAGVLTPTNANKTRAVEQPALAEKRPSDRRTNATNPLVTEPAAAGGFGSVQPAKPKKVPSGSTRSATAPSATLGGGSPDQPDKAKNVPSGSTRSNTAPEEPAPLEKSSSERRRGIASTTLGGGSPDQPDKAKNVPSVRNATKTRATELGSAAEEPALAGVLTPTNANKTRAVEQPALAEERPSDSTSPNNLTRIRNSTKGGGNAGQLAPAEKRPSGFAPEQPEERPSRFDPEQPEKRPSRFDPEQPEKRPSDRIKNNQATQPATPPADAREEPVPVEKRPSRLGGQGNATRGGGAPEQPRTTKLRGTPEQPEKVPGQH
jgi:serine/threonine protein kinase